MFGLGSTPPINLGFESKATALNISFLLFTKLRGCGLVRKGGGLQRYEDEAPYWRDPPIVCSNRTSPTFYYLKTKLFE